MQCTDAPTFSDQITRGLHTQVEQNLVVIQTLCLSLPSIILLKYNYMFIKRCSFL